MTKTTKLDFINILKPAFRSTKKNVILRCGRRFGKTYGATQLAILKTLSISNHKTLWVDTVQANIKRYIDEYFRPILGDIWNSVEYDKQSQILTFTNGSKIYFGSAERPENLEGFEYNLMILNEAGIILKKDGLWSRTLQPMTKGCQTYFVGTPKGKTGALYFELSQLAKTDDDWIEYHFSCTDSPFWNKQDLDKLKSSVANYIWQQEYLAEFADVYENSLLAPEDIKYFDNYSLDNFDKLFLHADTTHTAKTTSDYFCLTVAGQNKIDLKYYILDFEITKTLTPLNQIYLIISFFQKFPKIVRGTYDAVSNDGFKEMFDKITRELGLHFNFQGVKFDGDKTKHFVSKGHFDRFKSRSVLLPRNHTKIALVVDQLLAFPNKNSADDFVDGISGVLDNFTIPEKRKIEGIVF